MTLRLSVLCLLVVALASPSAGADQYTVTVRLLPGEDLSFIARQLAATHGVEIESIAVERGEVVISGSDSRVRLLRTSPHVVRVDSVTARLTIGPYEYDGSGSIKKIGTDTFVYDSAGRIVSGMAGASRRQDYSYDAFGNLQTITTAGNTSAPIRLHVDASTNRASAANPPSPSFNAYGSYDAAGNMTSFSDAGPFVYDALGMITDATIAGRRTVYLYTPSEERVASITLTKTGTSQWVEGPSEWTLRDPNQKILRRFLRTAPGIWTWDEDYIYRRNLLLAAEVNRPEKTLRFHLDHLGTPRLITGNGGAEVSRHTYYPFGLEATTNASSERLKFTGHERDQPNLDYMHARYYNGGWGRFLSVDPVLDLKLATRNPQGWNRYTYVRNNPINFTDPTGMVENPSATGGVIVNNSDEDIYIAFDATSLVAGKPNADIVIPLRPGESSNQFTSDADAVIVANGQNISGVNHGAFKVGASTVEVTRGKDGGLVLVSGPAYRAQQKAGAAGYQATPENQWQMQNAGTPAQQQKARQETARTRDQREQVVVKQHRRAARERVRDFLKLLLQF